MEGCSSIGNIDELYKSVIDLDEDYWTTKEVKNKVSNPAIAPQCKLRNPLLPIYYDVPKYFCCTHIYSSGYYYYLTHRQVDSSLGNCTALELVDTISDGNSKGYAKGPTMYIATDDLVVMPMSFISVMSLQNSMSIPVSDLEEKGVSIGIEEGVRILQASLTSTSALTNGLSHLLTKVKEEN